MWTFNVNEAWGVAAWSVNGRNHGRRPLVATSMIGLQVGVTESPSRQHHCSPSRRMMAVVTVHYSSVVAVPCVITASNRRPRRNYAPGQTPPRSSPIVYTQRQRVIAAANLYTTCNFVVNVRRSKLTLNYWNTLFHHNGTKNRSRCRPGWRLAWTQGTISKTGSYIGATWPYRRIHAFWNRKVLLSLPFIFPHLPCFSYPYFPILPSKLYFIINCTKIQYNEKSSATQENAIRYYLKLLFITGLDTVTTVHTDFISWLLS